MTWWNERLLATIAFAGLASACGTAVYSHVVIVTVDDPSGRLGPSPIQVSVFDKQMGYSRDWAARTMGPAAGPMPYTTTLSTTGAATVFDPPRPKTVDLSIALPALEDRGYFTLSLTPGHQPRGEERAWFCEYGSYFPAKDAASLAVRYTVAPEPKGWRLRLELIVPARRDRGSRDGDQR